MVLPGKCNNDIIVCGSIQTCFNSSLSAKYNVGSLIYLKGCVCLLIILV